MKVRVFNATTDEDLGECEIQKEYAGDWMLSRKGLRRFEASSPYLMQEFKDRRIGYIGGWLKGKNAFINARLEPVEGGKTL